MPEWSLNNCTHASLLTALCWTHWMEKASNELGVRVKCSQLNLSQSKLRKKTKVQSLQSCPIKLALECQTKLYFRDNFICFVFFNPWGHQVVPKWKGIVLYGEVTLLTLIHALLIKAYVDWLWRGKVLFSPCRVCTSLQKTFNLLTFTAQLVTSWACDLSCFLFSDVAVFCLLISFLISFFFFYMHHILSLALKLLKRTVTNTASYFLYICK